MKQRVILHSDMNNFYAGVECHHRPEIRNKPVVVGGDEEQRHGIVLAKNYIAKAAGIKTGETLWQARNKIDGLVVLPPNYPLYLRYSRLAREIYSKYTAQVESFGLDECWLDVSGDNGVLIANEIRKRIKIELGVTASVGVSYNKIFAKLGSDIKKPDATTVVNQENYKEVAWPLPVEDLLYVGSATKRKLHNYCINTIGELAQTPESFLQGKFGKVGNVLYSFANGLDQSPVMRVDEQSCIKSIGNSTTTPRDLVNNEDVKIILYVLSESVCTRMREHGFRCRTVQISVRDNELFWFERQAKLPKHHLYQTILQPGLCSCSISITIGLNRYAVLVFGPLILFRQISLYSSRSLKMKYNVKSMSHLIKLWIHCGLASGISAYSVLQY